MAGVRPTTLGSDNPNPRIEKYGFVQDIDFIGLSNLKGDNPTPQKDYHLTLSMAKELCMVENNAKGHEARLGSDTSTTG